MFKFRKVFSLEHDLLPRIPQDQLATEYKSPPIQSSTLPVDFVQHNYASSLHTSGALSNMTVSPTMTSSSLITNSISPTMNSSNSIINNNNNNATSTPPKILTFNDIKQYKLGSSYGSVIRISNSSSNIITSPNMKSMTNNSNNNSNINSSASSVNLQTSNNNSSNNSINELDDSNSTGTCETSEDFADVSEEQFLNQFLQQQNYCGPINMRIIGREKNGILLVARTSKVDGSLQTFIDSYDLNSKQFQNLLNYHGVITSASLSTDHNQSFLVFTVKLPEKFLDGKTAKEVYSSFIFELSKKTSPFVELEKNITHPMTYQFIPGMHDKSSATLLMFQNEECYTVKIPLKSEVELNKKPNNTIATNKNLIFKKCYWYQFDYNHQILYCLQMRQKSIVNYSSSGSNSSNTESILRLFSLQNGKFQQMDDNVSLNLQVDVNKVSRNVPFPLGASKFQSAYYESTEIHQNIHIVKLPAKGFCLCHQEETTKTQIKISIYMLHLKQKIRYSIPLNEMDEDIQSNFSNIRVLFDCFGSLLQVYIPGYFFQFIDCAAIDHEPCFGITLHRKDLSNLHEHVAHDSSGLISMRPNPYPKRISQHVIPFYFQHRSSVNASISPPISSSTSSTNLGSLTGSSSHLNNLLSNITTSSSLDQIPKDGEITQYLFDYYHGILYQYQFERKSITSLFEPGMEPGVEILSMHLAISHIGDGEIGKTTIGHAVKNNLITTELFKEYILSNTYRIFKMYQLDPIYLQSIPITISENLETTSPLKILKDLEISSITAGLYPKKESDFKKRFKSFEAKKSEIQSKEGPTFAGFIKNLIGIDDSPVDLPNLRKSFGPTDLQTLNLVKLLTRLNIDNQLLSNSVYEEDPFRDLSTYVTSVYEVWSQISQKESKDKLIDYAVIFRTVQILVVNSLYREIKLCYGGSNPDLNTIRDMKHPNRLIYFQALEKLYAAIEELYCPFPKDFYSQFASLGFYCLNRHLFLQFLQKGIFVVTKSFVNLLNKEFPDRSRLSKDDRNFINQIILQLKDTDQVIDELQTDTLNVNIIHEHIISIATQNINQKPIDLLVLDPNYINSHFIPLDTLLDFLKYLANQPTISPSNSGNNISTVQPSQPPSGSSSTNSSTNNTPTISSTSVGSSPSFFTPPNAGQSKYFTPPTSPIRLSSNNLSQLAQLSQSTSSLSLSQSQLPNIDYIKRAYTFADEHRHIVLNNIFSKQTNAHQ
ncbi:hypothetical protein DLAC_02795 [Tieghemostelium lacteum]|uniref:Gamma-secretase-activating protein C-terminal domain-containing protein n=1 Tax=Tieghemostelium lacteum TaxID=361077 RepID=A0A152A3A9_TIELA|nr:hypothetical protein DLAC_02795 [Tieghemostelium lacteum]|eukprot:KYR00752.1 hypothetical protein DLAC_02795 [Tieghemostelium lacteum]